MKAICPSCGTTYEGRETEDGIEAYDAIYGAWTLSCPNCGAPNLERPEPVPYTGPLGWPEALPLTGGWELTRGHAASSYGQRVLVSPEGDAFGPHDMLPLSAAAEMRGIKLDTLRARADAGTLPVVRLAGRLFVRADEAVTMPDPGRGGRPKRA